MSSELHALVSSSSSPVRSIKISARDFLEEKPDLGGFLSVVLCLHVFSSVPEIKPCWHFLFRFTVSSACTGKFKLYTSTILGNVVFSISLILLVNERSFMTISEESLCSITGSHFFEVGLLISSLHSRSFKLVSLRFDDVLAFSDTRPF